MESALVVPSGYRLVGADSIRAAEVITLRSSAGWPSSDEPLWTKCIAESLHVSAARDNQDNLVAVAFLAGNMRHAILCDLCVHPEHRQRGLARTLLFDRVAAIDTLKIQFIYTSLSPENFLRETYKSLGFRQTGGEFFWNRFTN